MNYCANRTRPWPALRTVSGQVLVSSWGMPRGHLYCILGVQWRHRRVILGSSCQAGQWSLEIRAVGLALRSHYSYGLTWPLCFKKKKIFFSFIWQCQVLVVTCGIFNLWCGMQDLWLQHVNSCVMWHLFPWPGVEPRLPALGAWSLSYGPPGKSWSLCFGDAFSSYSDRMLISPEIFPRTNRCLLGLFMAVLCVSVVSNIAVFATVP